MSCRKKAKAAARSVVRDIEDDENYGEDEEAELTTREPKKKFVIRHDV